MSRNAVHNLTYIFFRTNRCTSMYECNVIT